MIKMIITLKRREGMTHEEFKHYQQNVHRPLLMSIPEARRYIRRFVVSYPIPAPRYPEAEYDSVVEAWFDTMADLEALFFSDNFLKIVDPDHENFIDLSTFGRIISEEDVVIDSHPSGL
ncbi:EthD domain-containing protein [Streptomyces sp. 7R007]